MRLQDFLKPGTAQAQALPQTEPAPHVVVVGEVHAPGACPWTNGMRLTDAIACAGGLGNFARRYPVRVSHADGKAEIFNYSRALTNRSDNPVLRPGDVINVRSFDM